MKAQDRIKELMEKIAEEKGDHPLDHKIGGIWAYLDEEKERVNGILHEIVSALHDGAFDTQNCNYLHQMIEEKLV